MNQDLHLGKTLLAYGKVEYSKENSELIMDVIILQ